MDRQNRPRGREKHVTGGGGGVHRRGSGLGGSKPVGNVGGYSGRPPGGSGPAGGSHPSGGSGPTGGSSGGNMNDGQNGGKGILGSLLGMGGMGGGMYGGPQSGPGGMFMGTPARRRNSGCGCGCLIVLIVMFMLMGGCSMISNMFSMYGTGVPNSSPLYGGYTYGTGGYSNYGGYTQQQSAGIGDILTSLMGGQTGGSYASSPWNGGNTGTLNYSVANGARAKRTVIEGNGDDTVTVMVYMCGTDLESRGGMATADLEEMAAAQIGDNVNVIVFTGGCTGWKNNIISSRTNQVYQIKNGGLTCLMQDAGNDPMTDPETLAEYIEWCAKNFPANRNELILWDHGGGSISGYGYDQRHPNSGSMTLDGIDLALKNGGVDFDFVGFDACLMATLENGLMLSKYADYMIGSEETEPGVGWYYTNWLTELSKNTSMPTIEIGKLIADDFVNTCAQKCPGQQTTLSVVDLAELETTAPDALSDFSESTSKLIRGNDYKTVSNARSQSREFAQAQGIDQVDIINLADNIGTSAGKKLSKTLTSAVKYNLTSTNMTHAYGLSIYFPYRRASKVDSMIETYEEIGMDEDYARCIRDFAGMAVGGQAASGGTGSPLGSLLGSYSSSGSSTDTIAQILQSLASGSNTGNVSGLTGSNTDFLSSLLSGKSLEEAASYIEDNMINEEDIVWSDNKDGQTVLALPAKEWDLVQQLELNMFYDDGEGYIDLGLDNVYEFDDDGNLIGENDNTWLAINGQVVPYYFMSDIDDGESYTILGRVPAMLNGQRVNLILSFDSENPDGRILGAQTDYEDTETETVAKGLTELKAGDKLDFICDYYTYDGEFRDSYYMGEQMTVTDNMAISNVDVGGETSATYRITDIYNKQYWTPVMP